MASRGCPHCAKTIDEAEKICSHCGRDVLPLPPNRPWRLASIVVGAAVIAVLILRWGSTTVVESAAANVLVMRELDELRFTNDSGVDLHNCPVEIEGGFQAVIAELPSRGRASIPRAEFSRDMPRDEFYSRSLRGLRMHCYDDANKTVRVRAR